ncbi:unnamed protein product [Amoebophrya sp. A25]|nr:unnamed protein product [Amoebophrya sp. A25]|eukprot:GSA25T00002995001.1
MSNNRRVLLLCSQLLLTLAARAAGSKTGSISRAPPPPSPFGKQNPWNNTAMEYRALGRSGLRVSALSYGAWLTFTEDGQVGVNKAKQILKECIRQGINFFDNAESYGSFHGESEIIMGEALKQIFEEGRSSRSSSSSDTPSANAKAKDVDVVNIRREELVISTKLFNARGDGVNNKGLSRKHLIEGMRGSLQRLQLDYVDLVYAHRFDPTTPLEETVRAFNFLIDQGMALYWGTSEWTAEEIRRAHQVAEKLNSKAL